MIKTTFELEEMSRSALDYVQFVSPLSVEEQEFAKHAFDMQPRNGIKAIMRHCHLLPNQRYWHVTLFVGGNTLVMGRGEGAKRYEHVMRYADAALLYFWRYRKQRRAPRNSDFNFSLEHATKDLAESETARESFGMMEAHLLTAGLLATVDLSAKARPEGKKYVTLRDELQLIKGMLLQIQTKLGI